MLSELRNDNLVLTGFLREAHEICAKFSDIATPSLIEVGIDQAERRTWFLTKIATEPGERSGRCGGATASILSTAFPIASAARYVRGTVSGIRHELNHL